MVGSACAWMCAGSCWGRRAGSDSCPHGVYSIVGEIHINHIHKYSQSLLADSIVVNLIDVFVTFKPCSLQFCRHLQMCACVKG